MKKLFVRSFFLLISLLFICGKNANAENIQYRNSGLIHTFEAGYKYPIASESKIIYENLGVRKVKTLHPLELTYSIGYRFSNWVSLSVGSGLSYEAVDLRRYGDKIVSEYVVSGILSEDVYSNVDIPLLLDLRVYLSQNKFQPFLALKGGMYMLNSSALLLDGGIGCNFRLNKRCNLYLLASASLYPSIWGTSGEEPVMGRRNALAPGFKIGFSL